MYSEYIEPLRQEIIENRTASGEIDFESMPLLDSFLKESARLNSSESSKSHPSFLLKRLKIYGKYSFHSPKSNGPIHL